MNTPIHILNQLGVLTSFSVAKKITEEDINKYFSKHRKRGRSNSQIGQMLRDKIVSDIQNAIEQNKIPGLVSQQEMAEGMGIDKTVIAKIPQINKLILILSQKLSEKKYNKMTLCYFINSLVNVMNLTEDDFTKFHQQNKNNDDADDYEDETGDDEFTDEE
jgi:predicted XRE-type DNA-binding protein